MKYFVPYYNNNNNNYNNNSEKFHNIQFHEIPKHKIYYMTFIISWH